MKDNKLHKDKGALDLSIFALSELVDDYDRASRSLKKLAFEAAKYGLKIDHLRQVFHEKTKANITNVIDEKAFYEKQLQDLTR